MRAAGQGCVEPTTMTNTAGTLSHRPEQQSHSGKAGEDGKNRANSSRLFNARKDREGERERETDG